MKKFLAILLCLILVLSLAACGGEAPAPTEETVIQTEPDETTPTEPAYIFAPVELVNNELCTITIAHYTPGTDYDAMGIQILNKTDRNLYVDLTDTAINGAVFQGASLSLYVSPQEDLLEFCFLPWDDLQAMGIEAVTRFDFTLQVLDGDNYAEGPLFTDSFSICPYGEDKVVEFTRPTADQEITVVDNETCTVILLSAQAGDPDGYQVKLYLRNKTDKTLSFTAENGKLNGKDCDPLWIFEVGPGMQAVTTLEWWESDLENAGVSTVETILLELRAADGDNWRSGAIWTDEIEFEPF